MTGSASSGLSETVWLETASLPSPAPHGVVLSCEVHSEFRRRSSGSRHPPCRFDDFAVFRSPPNRHRSADAFHGLGSPSGFTGPFPPESPDFGCPPEVLRPYSDISAGGPRSRVSTPGTFRLQGFSPSGRFPPSGTFRSRGSEPLMGFTLQSFSPSRSRTPFGAVALLPFLISRSSALRTRGSRYPATSGLSSPRRSVFRPGPEGPAEPMLSWDFRLSRAHSLQTVVPASRSLPSCAFDVRSPRRPDDRRFKALPTCR